MSAGRTNFILVEMESEITALAGVLVSAAEGLGQYLGDSVKPPKRLNNNRY